MYVVRALSGRHILLYSFSLYHHSSLTRAAELLLGNQLLNVGQLLRVGDLVHHVGRHQTSLPSQDTFEETFLVHLCAGLRERERERERERPLV